VKWQLTEGLPLCCDKKLKKEIHVDTHIRSEGFGRGCWLRAFTQLLNHERAVSSLMLTKDATKLTASSGAAERSIGLFASSTTMYQICKPHLIGTAEADTDGSIVQTRNIQI